MAALEEEYPDEFPAKKGGGAKNAWNTFLKKYAAQSKGKYNVRTAAAAYRKTKTR